MADNIKKDYLSVTYDLDRIPKTEYPKLLVHYLIKRFNLRKNSVLVEIGCGRGEYLHAFQNEGIICTGIDKQYSAADYSPNLKIHHCDITTDKLPFENNVIDIVYHKSVIEHMYDPENLMMETIRVLKTGGKLIILTPDWHTQWKNFFEDFTHSRPYDVLALSDLLKVYGFNNFAVERFYQLPVLWKFPAIKLISKILQLVTNVYGGRWLTKITGIKFFRWSVELMILGYGEKGNK